MMKTLLSVAMVAFAGCVIYLTFRADKPPPKVASPAGHSEVTRTRTVVQRPVAAAALPAQPSPGRTESVFKRIFAGDKELSAVTPEALAAFLERNRTNAQSLIAAYQVTRDSAWLRLAANEFANDPEVLFNVVAQDVFPENRREWLDKLKAVLPDNGLGNYLSAREHFRNNQPDLALQDITEAQSKKHFHEFTPDKLQGLEDLYLSAGRPAAEAKALAMANVLLPHVQQLRDLSKDLKGAQAEYIAAGDFESARNVALAGVELGRHLSRGGGAKSLLNQVVGLVIEDESLGQLTAEQWGRQFSVDDHRAAIAREKAQVRAASRMFDQWSSNPNEAQMISYFDRAKLYGEPAALEWLANSIQR